MVNTASSLGRSTGVRPGFPFRGAIDALAPGDVGVIQMRNVEEGIVDWSKLARVTLPTKRAPDLLEVGDVIFATRGRRNFAVVLEQIPGPAVCSPHFFVLRSRDPQRLLPAFLAWQINQRPAQDYLQQAATGSHILNITRAAIESLPLSIPPAAVQRTIVELADAARRERDLFSALIANRQDQLSAVAACLLSLERSPA